MNRVATALTSGAAGALVLTAVHELARRHLPNAPRMDLLGMRALRRIAPPLREPGVRPTTLHRIALAGDLLANTLYYAAIPARSRAETWTRATALGIGAGAGALLLPESMGLGTPPHSEHRANQIMTLAWYTAGAAAAAGVATALRR